MSAPSHPTARGFYVFQAALGSPLQFHPALGTSELDRLMDAYLPCPGTIQDKRASISVDFFDHFRLTGESIKFYQVPDWVSSTTSSPNSAQDSGYGSSFTASPLAPTWSWGSLETATSCTPSTSSASTPQIPSRRRKQSSCTRQSTSSGASAADFSSVPGMKILTRDGRDVTNTAARGCKTKEQRDHAHLMRIMKACDSCKRKKVRCDPSHRTRASPISPTEQPARSAKKPRISNSHYNPEMAVPSFDPAILSNPASLPSLPDSFEFETFDFLNESPADEQASWDEFLRFNGELDSVFPDGLDNLDVQPTLPPVHPSRPMLSGFADPNDASAVLPQREDIAVQDVPKLPYLEENDEPHHYVDFNLYSPSSSFSDTEASVSSDLPVNSISSKRQPSDTGVNEPLARSIVYRPEGYPDTSSSDHSRSTYSSRMQTRSSTDSSWSSRAPTGPITQVPASALPVTTSALKSPSHERLSTTNVGFLDTNFSETQTLRDPRSPALRITRTVHVSKDSNQVSVVSGWETPASARDVPRRQATATTRPGDSTGLTLAGSTVTADLLRPRNDVIYQATSGEDDRCSRLVIEPHRVRAVTAESHSSENTPSKSGLSKRTAAPVVVSPSNEQPGSENHHAATAANELTTLHRQTTRAVISRSLLESTVRTTVPADLDMSQAPLLSRRPPTGTDCSTAMQDSSRPRSTPMSPSDLVCVVGPMVASAVATALASVAVFSPSNDVVQGATSSVLWETLCAMACTHWAQSQKTDDSSLSAKSIRTRRALNRVDMALNRIPILV